MNFKALFSIAFMLPNAAWAIIVSDFDQDAEHHITACQYEAVVVLAIGDRYGRGAGTLISDQWVLTAAHVASHLEAGGMVHHCGGTTAIQDIVIHPDYRRRDAHADVALLKLKTPLSLATATLSNATPNENTKVIFVGAGAPGDGHTGVQKADGQLRHATNTTIDAPPGWLAFGFDPDIEGQGISGPGDSGGPALIGDADQGYTVVGISSWQDNRNQGAEGLFGVREYYVDVATFAPWIKESITTWAG